MVDAPTPVLLFDVNETLLDMAALDPVFADAFGDAGVRPVWFGQMLQLALTATVIGEYRAFGGHAMAALAMTGERLGVPVDDALRTRVREGMTALPAHPDVRPALARLRAEGARLATLTNSTVEVVEAQLAHAGLRDLFEAALSADTVQRLKPAAEPYSYAAQNLGVPVQDVTLIAAHAWDVAGARAAGARTVFVARPGQVMDPAAPPPDRVVADLSEL
jgi:2-haloacid dehalogenase